MRTRGATEGSLSLSGQEKDHLLCFQRTSFYSCFGAQCPAQAWGSAHLAETVGKDELVVGSHCFSFGQNLHQDFSLYLFQGQGGDKRGGEELVQWVLVSLREGLKPEEGRRTPSSYARKWAQSPSSRLPTSEECVLCSVCFRMITPTGLLSAHG